MKLFVRIKQICCEKFVVEKIYEEKIKILIALIVGFAFAMILMSIAIYFGFTNEYSTEVNILTVKIIGIPIYEITKPGTEYVGKSLGIPSISNQKK